MGNKDSKTSDNEDDASQVESSVVVNRDGLVIWLDGSIDNEEEDDDDDCRNTIDELQHVVKTVKTFTNSDQCIEFIKTVNNEKVYVITSGSLGKDIMHHIHDMSQIDSIFIFCGDEKKHEQWAKEWSKIKGVHTDITSICDALKELVQKSEEKNVSTTSVETTNDENLDRLDSSFMYTKIFKEILLSIEFEETHRKEFVDYCRAQFSGNSCEIDKIKKFEKEYHSQSPIWWYTYECFLYPMLDRALRLMDIDTIIKMGFFIRDLHCQIVQLHREQFVDHHSTELFTVYRGQNFSRDDFQQMSKKKGGLISFNGFLSTTKDRQTALDFARRCDSIGILFVMTIGPSISAVPFASIKNMSSYQNTDEEILFSMHTVFRINDIQSLDENHRLFEMNLKFIDHEDKDLRMREETSPGPNGWYRLALLLLELDQYKKAQRLFDVLLEQTTDEKEKADIYYQLGLSKTNQGEYEEALKLHEKSLEIRQTILPVNHPDLASSYNSIGSTYSNLGENLKALLYYDRAHEVC